MLSLQIVVALETWLCSGKQLRASKSSYPPESSWVALLRIDKYRYVCYGTEVVTILKDTSTPLKSSRLYFRTYLSRWIDLIFSNQANSRRCLE